VNLDEMMIEDEAKDLIRPSSESAWEKWHKRQLIPHYIIPGTKQRRYLRSELEEWVEKGKRP
jgi:hypothetical protein